MKTSITGHIEIAPYRYLLLIVIMDTKTYSERCKESGYLRMSETNNGAFIVYNKGFIGNDKERYISHIYIEADTKDGNININTVAHEAFHAIFHINNDRGIKLCKKSEEIFAYQIGNLTEEIYDLYLEYNKFKKKDNKRKKHNSA